MQTEIIYSNQYDPWYNLAVEEYLLANIQSGMCCLYLWQNQNTVVIGKNQNPWRECRLDMIEQENGKLARRISGGGAVFHDLGNLNFSFVVDRKYYNLTRQLQVILQATNNLGINAKFSGRNDLTVDERKFSGNAFYLRPQYGLHHGTILIDADMQKLSRYLQVSKEKIHAKGVKSVAARVINLKEYSPDISIDEMKNSIVAAFAKIYALPAHTYSTASLDQQQIQTLYSRHSSWEWRFAQAPKFDIEFEKRFSWGGIEVCLKLKDGKIAQANIFSDAMDEEFIEVLPAIWRGCRFCSLDMVDALQKVRCNHDETRKQIITDLCTWIHEKSL